MKKFFKWLGGILLANFVLFVSFLYNKVIIARVTASLTGTVTDTLVTFFGWPFQTWAAKSPHSSATEWDKWMYILGSLCLELLFLLGAAFLFVGLGYWMYASYTKRGLSWSHPELIAQRELAIAVATVDPPSRDLRESKKAVEKLIDTFSSGVADLFSLERGQYRTYWLIEDGDGYETYSKERYLSVQDKHVISTALQHPDKRMYDDDLTKKYDSTYDGKHVFFVRNEGNFKLAFILFISKENAVTEQKRREFARAVSYVMLLGHVDGIRRTMLELVKEAKEVQ